MINLLAIVAFALYLTLADYRISQLRTQLGPKKSLVLWCLATVLPIVLGLALVGWAVLLSAALSVLFELLYLGYTRRQMLRRDQHMLNCRY